MSNSSQFMDKKCDFAPVCFIIMHEKDRQVAHERIKLGMSNEFRSNLTNYFLISTTQHFRTEILDIFGKSKIPNES